MANEIKLTENEKTKALAAAATIKGSDLTQEEKDLALRNALAGKVDLAERKKAEKPKTAEEESLANATVEAEEAAATAAAARRLKEVAEKKKLVAAKKAQPYVIQADKAFLIKGRGSVGPGERVSIADFGGSEKALQKHIDKGSIAKD